MAENPASTETRTVRELAREKIAADDNFKACYLRTLNLNQTIEERVDALIATDIAAKAMHAATAAYEAAKMLVTA